MMGKKLAWYECKHCKSKESSTGVLSCIMSAFLTACNVSPTSVHRLTCWNSQHGVQTVKCLAAIVDITADPF